MKNSQKGFAPLLLIIIIALVVIGGGYYYWQKNKGLCCTEPVVEQNSVATSNWKTYTDSTYGFEFSYPSNWTVQNISFTYQGKQSPAVNVVSPLNTSVKGYEKIGANYIVQLQYYNNAAHVTINSFVKVHEAGEQEAKVIPTTEEIKATQEYKDAEKIIASAKVISASATSSLSEDSIVKAIETLEKVTLTKDSSGSYIGKDIGSDSKYFINKIIRGDLNSDGKEDAFVWTTSCGASCGSGYIIVMNQSNGNAGALNVIPPGVITSGAAQYHVNNIEINSGIIKLNVSIPDFKGNTTTADLRYKLVGQKLVKVD